MHGASHTASAIIFLCNHNSRKLLSEFRFKLCTRHCAHCIYFWATLALLHKIKNKRGIEGTGRHWEGWTDTSRMESSVRLSKPFQCGAPLLPKSVGLMRRHTGHHFQQRPVTTQAAAETGQKSQSFVAKWAEDAGLRTNVALEDLTGDRRAAPCAPLVV